MLYTNYKLLATKWFVPFIFATGLFFLVRPIMAQAVEGQLDLGSFQAGGVGVEAVDGYSQVYYSEGGEKVFVNLGDQNKRHPDLNGDYIVWAGDVAGAGQVYRYHIPTNTLLQITHSGTNLQPKVSLNGRVVWEGWVQDEDTWQIFFFDGTKVTRLTKGDMSRYPHIAGDYISFGRFDITGTWRGIVYSISRGEEVEVTIGIDAKEPRVDKEGNIILAGAGTEKPFPLMAEDLFLLDLPPLTGDLEFVSEAEVWEELEATPSGSLDF